MLQISCLQAADFVFGSLISPGVVIINTRNQPDFATIRGEALAARVEPMGSNTLECWSCKRRISHQERSEADGNCPLCGVEIDLDDL